MELVAVVCLGLALSSAEIAHPRALTMRMSNGWNFTFSGNVNAFLYYEKSNADGNTTVPDGVPPGGGAVNATRITTGLLPAFAVFDAKGKEGSTTSACTSGLHLRSTAGPAGTTASVRRSTCARSISASAEQWAPRSRPMLFL
jgi:hypothetical protein